MPLRLLLASDFLDPADLGGSGRLLLSVARGLVERGHRVSFLTGATGNPAGHFTHEGVQYPWTTFPYQRAGARGGAFLARTARAVRAAGRHLQAHHDVVIPVQPLVAAALGRLRCPSLYLFLSPWSLEFLAERTGVDDPRALAALSWRARLACVARRWIERRAVHGAQGWVSISETSARHLAQIHGIARDHIRVAHLGVDAQRFTPVGAERRRALRAAFGVDDDTLLICCVRRLVPRTGVDLLLEALARPELAHLDVRLLVAGRGKAEAALQDQCRRLGLESRARFLGYVSDDDLPDLYRAADLCAVPTRALEGFGLATVEALACGTPVLATPVGGSLEILSDLDPRLLTAEPSAPALAAGLLAWSDRARLAALRGACRAHAVTRFSWQAMTEALEAEASRLTGMRPGASPTSAGAARSSDPAVASTCPLIATAAEAAR